MTMLTWGLRAMLMVVAATASLALRTPSFTLTNNCGTDIWPGILPNAGQPLIQNGGFRLPAGSSVTLTPPAGWSGRIWARTGCSFDSSGGACETGDCGGQQACNGAGGKTPATLAEFTLAGGQPQDFYDVSLVDGYNVALTVSPAGGSGPKCSVAGCSSDLLASPGLCPAELQVMNPQGTKLVGCRSACEAFGSPEYCCTGEYSTPDTCRPSKYSEGFKRACPAAYSYAYDDPTSTFTCTGAMSYTISFCH